jgi:hypothetical protein
VRRKKEESAQSTGEPREMVTPMLKHKDNSSIVKDIRVHSRI